MELKWTWLCVDEGGGGERLRMGRGVYMGGGGLLAGHGYRRGFLREVRRIVVGSVSRCHNTTNGEKAHPHTRVFWPCLLSNVRLQPVHGFIVCLLKLWLWLLALAHNIIPATAIAARPSDGPCA